MTDARPPLALRALLRAYPRSLRDEFGPDMAQLFADRRRHGGLGSRRLLIREALDCLRTAPRLHLEDSMTRNTALAVIVVVAFFGVTMAGGVGLLPAIVLAVVLLALRRERPVADAAASRWWLWFVAAAAAVGVLFVVLAVDGDELTAVGWTLAYLSGNGAIVLTIVGIGSAVVHLVRHGRSAPAA